MTINCRVTVGHFWRSEERAAFRADPPVQSLDQEVTTVTTIAPLNR